MSIIIEFHIFELVYAQNLTQKTIVKFWITFSEKGYFRFNAEKMNITTGLFIFKLV